MFKKVNRDQTNILPINWGDVIPKNDLVFTIIDVVRRLNLKPLKAKYSNLGQNGYDPEMLLTLLFYAYTHKLFSSRKIEEAATYDVRFMYVVGENKPDFRTISDFRKNNVQLLKELFKQIVLLCKSEGMVQLNQIAIDGTKVKASASGKRSKDAKELDEQIKTINDEIAYIMEQAEKADLQDDENDTSESSISMVSSTLEDKQARQAKLLTAQAMLESRPGSKRVNLTDLDCRSQKGTGPGYNAQIAVDCQSGIIVGLDAVSDPNDLHQLMPMIDQVEDNTQTKGQHKQVLTDIGYSGAGVYQQLEERRNIDAYVPPQLPVKSPRTPDKAFDKSRFEYDLEKLTCRCPLGQPMRIQRQGSNKSGQPYVQFIGMKCTSCPSQRDCTTVEYRSLVVLKADPLISRMKHKMQTLSGRTAMKIRKSTVEPVIGNLKEQMGFRQFHLRGKPKVKGELTLLGIAYNLKKMHSFLKNNTLSAAFCQQGKTFIDSLFFVFRGIFFGVSGAQPWSQGNLLRIMS